MLISRCMYYSLHIDILKVLKYTYVILKKGVSPSGDLTIARVLIYNIIIALTTSFGIPLARSMSLILFLTIESNNFEKSIKSNMAVRFLAFTPSIIRRIVSI